HPYYLSARTDLRRAQILLRVSEEPEIAKNLKIADDEIEASIREMDRGAVLAHEDLNDHPNVDLGGTRSDRFDRIRDLMRTAISDINREEDSPAAKQWRDAALRHIAEAQYAFHRAGVDAGFEPRSIAGSLYTSDFFTI